MREEGYTFLHLLGDGPVAMAVCRIESLVITIGTASPPHLSVTVGTGEAPVKGYLLNLAIEQGMKVCTELVIIKCIITHVCEDTKNPTSRQE